MDSNKPQIRAFIAQFFRTHALKDDQNIFELGVINSLFALQLVMFVENTFAIALDEEDLDLDNFSSIDAIDRLVQRKKGVVAAMS